MLPGIKCGALGMLIFLDVNIKELNYVVEEATEQQLA